MLVLRTIDQLQVQVITEVALARRVEVAQAHQTITLLAEVQAHRTSVLLAEVQEEASVVPLEVAPQEDPDQEGEINSPFFLETVFSISFYFRQVCLTKPYKIQ